MATSSLLGDFQLDEGADHRPPDRFRDGGCQPCDRGALTCHRDHLLYPSGRANRLLIRLERSGRSYQGLPVGQKADEVGIDVVDASADL